MKKMNFFNSGSVQRLREDQECVNLLSQCSKALSQFRKRSEQLLNREETIDQMVDNMLLSQKKLNK